MNKIFAAALFLLTLSTGYAQVGSWQSYTDMKNVKAIAMNNSRIVAATSGGMFFYDIATGEYQKYTNVDGLASINLTSAFVDAEGRVFVGATSGYVNMLEPEVGWVTIPDIARSVSRPQRGVRTMREHGGLLYIATDFGVTVYDAASGEFRETYTKFGALPLNTGVNDIYFSGSTIFVATDAGIGYADLNYENLQDPAQWGSYTTADGLPDDIVIALASFRGQLVAGTQTGLYTLDGNIWIESTPKVSGTIVDLVEQNGVLCIAQSSQVLKLGSSGFDGYIGESLRNGKYQSDIVIRGLVVHGVDVYIATNYGIGITEEVDDSRASWTFRNPNGPNANQFPSLSVDAFGNLWSASGRDGNGKGIYMFDGETWSNYNMSNTPGLPTNNVILAAAASNGDMWFGTWGRGVVHRDTDGNYTVFNPSTVPDFPGIPEDNSYSAISGLAIDRSGTVYSLHTGNTQQMLGRYGSDRVWRFYGDPASHEGPDFSGLSIDEFGNKWIIVKTTTRKGLLIFNENGTVDDQSDDNWTAIAAGDGGSLLAGDVSSLVVDGFGDVWIGSNAGIRTIFNPQEPTRVTRTCYNTRCNIEGEAITCLAVDPVNNKWIGTNAGVFVLSNDGSTILNQFNTDNSQLLDNKITSIIVHPVTGVAYIGTDKGLSAYTTPYQQAQADFTDLKIYPNPFKPKSDLEVSIQGLVEESSIKILSVSGNLVKEFTTPGGNIGFWDGKTSSGDWAPTGIYYIAAYSADGKKAAVGKVAVVNE